MNSKCYSRSEYFVVREQSGRGKDEAKCQLERALERQYQLVIVEPHWQGDRVIR